MRFTPTLVLSAIATVPLLAQDVPPGEDPRLHEIVAAVSAERLEADIRKLVTFGTRNTMSDTLSPTRGIGAARRWIKAEFDRIAAGCGGCLDVRYVSEVFPASRRLPTETSIVNVVAIQWGRSDRNRMVIMSGDIDSRVSNGANAVDSSPGANDNASGMAGAIEAARLLSRYRFDGTVVYMGLAGEEQGLYGGGTVARMAVDSGWNIQAVLNNDMIGNIQGVDGVIDNTTARVFSDGIPPLEVDLQRIVAADPAASAVDSTTTVAVDREGWSRILREIGLRRRTGGDVDGASRQLARYVDVIADRYVPNLDMLMVYRLDRFGRGGHHTPFANEGFPAVRIMEAHENYTRQHQDIRVEDGIAYGDVIEGVNFDYARKLTGLNAATLAALAWAPGPPRNVTIRGAVRPEATMRWQPPGDPDNVAGYRVYWRLTDSPTWDHSTWVGSATEHTFDGLIIDNYFFGVAAVGRDGNESVVAFPTPGS